MRLFIVERTPLSKFSHATEVLSDILDGETPILDYKALEGSYPRWEFLVAMTGQAGGIGPEADRADEVVAELLKEELERFQVHKKVEPLLWPDSYSTPSHDAFQ